MDRTRHPGNIINSKIDGHSDISDWYSRYLEPFSPPDQNNDFFFPANPERHQLYKDIPSPGSLSESLSSSLLHGNQSFPQSSADPLYPETQLHCPSTEALPQDGDFQAVGGWASEHPSHLQSEEQGESSLRYSKQSTDYTPIGARLPIGHNLLDLRFIDDLGSEEGHAQGASLVLSNDAWQDQSTPCLTNLDYARSRLHCPHDTDPSYSGSQQHWPSTEDLPQDGAFQSVGRWASEHQSHLQSEEQDDSSLSYSKTLVDHTPIGARLPAGLSLLGPRFIDDLGSEGGHSQGPSWLPSSDTWQTQSTLCLTNLDYAKSRLHYPRDTHLSCLGHSEAGFPEVALSAAFAPEEVSKEEIQGFEDIHALGRSPLQKRKSPSGRRDRGPNSWEFLMRLLASDLYNPSLIKWEDEENYVFRLVNPSRIAQMWTSRKNQDNEPNKNNFARNLRYYYQSGILISVREKQYVYKCGEEAVKFYRSLLSS